MKILCNGLLPIGLFVLAEAAFDPVSQRLKECTADSSSPHR